MSSKVVADIREKVKQLNLMEVAELIKALEDDFGVSAAAPAAAVATAMPATAAAAVAEEKSEYKVTLKESGADKIKVIKALRTVTSLSLGAAKEAVENTPFVVSEAASKDDSQKIKKALEEAGASIVLS